MAESVFFYYFMAGALTCYDFFNVASSVTASRDNNMDE